MTLSTTEYTHGAMHHHALVIHLPWENQHKGRAPVPRNVRRRQMQEPHKFTVI